MLPLNLTTRYQQLLILTTSHSFITKENLDLLQKVAGTTKVNSCFQKGSEEGKAILLSDFFF